MIPRFAKPTTCQDCALHTLGIGFAPPAGPSHARLALVGESLGYQEAMHGEPFIGAAGGMLDRLLRRAQISRPHVRIANSISCRPPEDWLDGAPWQHSALTHCRPHLTDALASPTLDVVVALGTTPMKQILNLWGVEGAVMQNFHGTIHRSPDDRYWVIPTFHPSFLQRGATNLFDVAVRDLRTAARILERGVTRRPFTLHQDPPFAWFERWAADAIARLRQSGFAWLATDIETPDKSGGRDENELTSEDTSTKILRINFATHGEEGITVPYDGPFIPIIHQLLNAGFWLALWNKSYDESRLRFNGVSFRTPAGEDVTLIDGMWAAHYLHSDLPLGLGFWAPFYSDYGAWKHLGKQKGCEAEYAAVDGLQTYRVVPEGIVADLQRENRWDSFWRHSHLREQYVLRPAYQAGIPVSEPKLDAFHDKLQTVAAERLQLISESGLANTFYPKLGYAKPPKDTTKPPVGISGAKHRAKGDHAKADYLDSAITLISREIPIPHTYCSNCGELTKLEHKDCLPATPDSGPLSLPPLVTEHHRQLRWFWQLPFNPDANQQILNFIKASGETPGKAKKTKKETANKDTLRNLAKKTGNPVYLYLLDYKAIKKVDSTYALGLKKRIWRSDGRIHPEITQRPSMFRDSCVNPNIQNIIADKDTKGPGSLAAGLRYCVIADPGYRFIEVDYAGTEAVDTGWYIGDPNYIRLATLGVHAYLTSHLLYDEKKLSHPADLAWSDSDLSEFFADIKKKFKEMYDKAKRCVHGNNYGLTTYGMVNNFPDVFHSLKEADKVQSMYYRIAPGLPAFHEKLRQVAYDTEAIGGSYVDDYYALTSGKHHPFGYKHDFYGVMTFRPLSETDYRKLQWIARKQGLDKHPRVRFMHGRPFEAILGEDSKRVIAMYPQSTSAGKLKEAELTLFHPESPDYIGELADGRTPLCAPIHDSLLLHVPDRIHELVIEKVIEVMRRPTLEMPCPAEWNIGTHIRTNVAVKVSPIGGSWGDCEDIDIPNMVPQTASETLYLPADEAEWEDIDELATPITRSA